jgi:lipoyl synthase
LQTMEDLRYANVDVITIGQYLQPTSKHLPVDRFVHPDEFAELREAGYEMGFDYVESGPLVRSSYHSENHVFAGYGRKVWEQEKKGLAIA